MYKVAFTAQNLGYAPAIAILLRSLMVTVLSVMILAISNPLKGRSDL